MGDFAIVIRADDSGKYWCADFEDFAPYRSGCGESPHEALINLLNQALMRLEELETIPVLTHGLREEYDALEMFFGDAEELEDFGDE